MLRRSRSRWIVAGLFAATLFTGISVVEIEAMFRFPTVLANDVASDEAPPPEIVPTPTPQPVPPISELERALQQQQWQQASDITWARLGRGEVLPDGREFRQFPCEELAEIDRLWRRSSGDRYSFSIQRDLWADLARQYPLRDRTYTEFRTAVGWMDVSPQQPVGHFPSEQFWATGQILRFGCGDAACSFPRTEVEETRLALEFVFPRLLQCRIR
ncbi:MAG: GUN4 domain-containing protein [Cyanobacteria bacterium SID2]|nr:GUN4 domain-containing protein [Cyanobacteria bacterium SID2]MBP0004378.1 GUN4 domain-containing protein [Cyanobacteria bacterium SBC]